jgi:hypothetical protein
MRDYVNTAISRCFSLLRYSAFVIVLFYKSNRKHFPMFTSSYITRCKHGKCFLFLNYKITGSEWKRLRARDWLTAVLMWDYVNTAISRCFSLFRYSAFVIVLFYKNNFSFSQTCARVYITRCKHGNSRRCFLFLKK